MKNLVVITLLVWLASCGSGNESSSVGLKVTSSMMISNSSYGGGLLIQGFQSNGNVFSQFVSTGTNQITVSVPKGKWRFQSVAWLGNSLFNGQIHCGLSDEISVTGDKLSVDLITNASNCSDAFGKTSNRLATNHYKPLRIITCGHFYKTSGSVVSDGYSDSSFCNEASAQKSSVKYWAASARVSPLEKVSGNFPWTPKLSEGVCINGSEGLLSPTNNLNINTRSTPIRIDLFASSGCQEDSLQVSYDFTLSAPFLDTPESIQGIAYDYLSASDPKQRHESILLDETNYNNLFLTPNITKRGTTSLKALMPHISCSSGPCLPIPLLPEATTPFERGSVDYVGNSGRSILAKEITAASETCSSFEWDIANSPELLNNNSTNKQCYEEDLGNDHSGRRGLFVRPQFNESNCLSGCSLAFKVNGVSQTPIIVRSSVQNNNMLSLVDRFNTLFQSLGHQSSYSGLGGIFRILDSLRRTDRDYGRLSQVREMFGADGPGGILRNYDCLNANSTEIISFMEDGEFRTYRVKLLGNNISGKNIPIPKYICEDLNPATSSCSKSVYDVEMILSRLVNAVWETENIIRFDCSRKVGQMERQEIKGLSTSLEKIYWNTQNSTKSRFETYYSYGTFNAAGVVNQSHSRVERAEKISESQIRLDSYFFNSNLSNSQYSQHMRHETYSIFHNSQIGMVFKEVSSQSPQAQGPFSIFSEPVLGDIRSNPQTVNTAQEGKASLVISPNGQFALKAWIDDAGNKLHLTQLRPSLVDTNETMTPYPYTQIRAAINNSNHAVVCYADNSVKQLKAKVYNGTNWLNVNSGAVLASSVGQFNCHISSSGDVTIISSMSSAPTYLKMIGGQVSSPSTFSSLSTITDSSGASNNFYFASKLLSSEQIGVVVMKADPTNYVIEGFTLTNGTGSLTLTSSSTAQSTPLTTTNTINRFATSEESSSGLTVYAQHDGGQFKAYRYLQSSMTTVTPASNFYYNVSQTPQCINTSSQVYLNAVDGSSCDILDGSYVRGIETNYFKGHLNSLNPGSFNGVFTPNSSFKFQ